MPPPTPRQGASIVSEVSIASAAATETRTHQPRAANGRFVVGPPGTAPVADEDERAAGRPLPRPRDLLAAVQRAGAPAGRRRERAAARAGPLPRDLRLQPRRVLHGARRRPQAPHRHRHRGALGLRARAARGARADLAGRPRAAVDAGRGSTASRCARRWRTRASPSCAGTSCPTTSATGSAACSPTRLFPVLTPLAVDPAHPFPYISGLSLNLAVVLVNPRTGKEHFARVKVPPVLPRLLRVRARARRVAAGRHVRHPVRAARGRHRRAPRPALPGHGGARALHLPGHPQRGPRGRGGRRREPPHRAGAGADPPPVRAAGAPRGRGRHGRARASTCWSASSASPDREVYRLPGAARPARRSTSSPTSSAPTCTSTRSSPAPTPTSRPPRAPRPATSSPSIRKQDVLLQHPYDSFSTSVQAFIEQAAADPRGPRHQADPLPHQRRLPHRRRPHRRRRGRQAGARGRRDQGPLRRAEQHLAGPASSSTPACTSSTASSG